MKFEKKAVGSLLLAAAMTVSLAACGGSKQQDGFAISGENVDVNNVALRPDGEAGLIVENGGKRLVLPLEYVDLLTIEKPESGSMLFTVSETASIEADKKQGGTGDGAGWLFSIGTVSWSQVREMLCSDMSGVEIFARDDEDAYYAYYHPTDVRLVRESYDNEEDMNQWTELNEWAWSKARSSFVAENNGLTAESYGNSDLAICLARAAFAEGTEYTLSTTELGPQSPNGVDAEPYVMELLRNTEVEALDSEEAPDGEYVVLNFPKDDYRFDFFLAEGDVYRQTWSGNEQLFRVKGGSVKAVEVMQQWYHALADASGASVNVELGYTPDDLVGRWAEKAAGRGLITITKEDAGSYDVLIEWANGAAEQYVWEMKATAGEGGMLRYENGRHLVRTYESADKFTEEVKYENGTGVFTLNSANEIMWQDDMENAGEDCVFISVD